MRMLAIPHNSNVSDGRMFEPHTFEGEPIGTRVRRDPGCGTSPSWKSSRSRARPRPIPRSRPTIEFAGFEIMDTVMSPGFAAE